MADLFNAVLMVDDEFNHNKVFLTLHAHGEFVDEALINIKKEIDRWLDEAGGTVNE